MHRVYHRWDSPSLGRPMELLVHGHAGAPVIVFPTSRGRFFEYEDRGMVDNLAHQIQQGWVQLICLDSVDAESWYNYEAHPRQRLQRHDQYERYVIDEVLPFVRSQNSNPFTIAHGCSFGASHAVMFALRHPTHFRRVLACSGLHDLRRFLGGYEDDESYLHTPTQFIAGSQPGEITEQIKRVEIILACGRDDPAAWSNSVLSDALWSKGVWHALRWWDGWAHDWPYWQQMTNLYLSGAD